MLTEAGDWRSRDLEVLWHPCTQMREHPDTLPLVPIARGEGAWLVGYDGRRYLDAVSSWWTNLFGHGEPRIGAAIARQAQTLEQVMLAGFSHAPAVQLAERLLALAPRQADRKPLAKVFYADNGSAGVEVALKMAFHYFHNRGEHRRTSSWPWRTATTAKPSARWPSAIFRCIGALCAAAQRSPVRAIAGRLPGRTRRIGSGACRTRGRCAG